MELMTVAETARLLKVTPVTVRRYVASKRLPAVRVGSSLRIRRDDVERLLTAVEGIGVPGLIGGKIVTPAHSLWRLVGISQADDGVTDVSANKHKYLAEAYADLHKRR